MKTPCEPFGLPLAQPLMNSQPISSPFCLVDVRVARSRGYVLVGSRRWLTRRDDAVFGIAG